MMRRVAFVTIQLRAIQIEFHEKGAVSSCKAAILEPMHFCHGAQKRFFTGVFPDDDSLTVDASHASQV